jgi:hypothetical protein
MNQAHSPGYESGSFLRKDWETGWLFFFGGKVIPEKFLGNPEDYFETTRERFPLP